MGKRSSDCRRAFLGLSAAISLRLEHIWMSLYIQAMSDEVPAATTGNGAPADQAATPTGVAAAATPATPKYGAALSINCSRHRRTQILPTPFAESVRALEKALGMPVWLFVQASHDDDHGICVSVERAFFDARQDLPQGSPVAVLIESPGGDADAAYAIGKLLQRRCGKFTAIVVNWAKSAATLLSLGASEIILAEHGQLGPLDVQLYDAAREEYSSALNETQALERLHVAGLEALLNTLYALRRGLRNRSNGATKKFEHLLPHAVKFVAESMRPLYEKVDVVQYTARLRDLKIAEEYAIRLLRHNIAKDDAEILAKRLVEDYPDHGFNINFEEAERLDMPVREPNPEEAGHLDRILQNIRGVSAFGKVVQI